MSQVNLGTVFKCDLCQKETTHAGTGRPQNIAQLCLSGNHSGFHYRQYFDVCQECFPKGMWQDPPTKNRPPESTIKSIFSKIKMACTGKARDNA